MMVILSSPQLVPLVERAIEQAFGTRPENLSIEPTFLCGSHPDWRVRAEFDARGERVSVDLTLEPRTGRLVRAMRG